MLDLLASILPHASMKERRNNLKALKAVNEHIRAYVWRLSAEDVESIIRKQEKR